MKIFNKRRIMVLVMVMASLMFGIYQGFYGYVEHNPGTAAPDARVEVKNDSYLDTADCDNNGYYYDACLADFYDMKAFDEELYHIKLNQECTGKLGGDRVDFLIGDHVED